LRNIKVEETDESGFFRVTVAPDEMKRLHNIGAALDHDERAVLEGMLVHGIGYAKRVLEMSKPDMMKAIRELAEIQKG
jgi:hypothetical protein